MSALLMFSILLAAGAGSEQSSVIVKSAQVESKDALSETEYQGLVNCTVTKNTSAVEAYVDTRFELGRGLASKLERETGVRVGPKQLFEGCFEFKTQSGTFPFNFDRLVSDWASHFKVIKDDPYTLDKQMGVTRVSSFAEYVSCVRQKNSSAAIQLFVSGPLNTMGAAEQFNKLGEKCPPENGVSLKFNMTTLAEALKEKGAQN